MWSPDTVLFGSFNGRQTFHRLDEGCFCSWESAKFRVGSSVRGHSGRSLLGSLGLNESDLTCYSSRYSGRVFIFNMSVSV